MLNRVVDELVVVRPTLFSVVDGAREPTIARRMRDSGFPYQTLYEGESGVELAPFGPYLAELPQEPSVLRGWVDVSWGKSQGVYLTSDATLFEIRRHMRRFLTVEFEGRKLYFRFYDPRVLRRFLPQCTYEEWGEFFGPIDSYLVESEDGMVLLRFRREADEAEPERLTLTP